MATFGQIGCCIGWPRTVCVAQNCGLTFSSRNYAGMGIVLFSGKPDDGVRTFLPFGNGLKSGKRCFN